MTFRQIKPQKARGKLLESMWTDPKWVAEKKYDGDRRISQFIGGIVRFTGTRESVDGTGYVEKTENLPHLSDERRHPLGVDYVRALDGTVLDGEIVAPFAKDLPGGKSKYVTSIMGSSPEEAIRKQREHGWLEYMVFDCLWYKGEDVRGLPLALRRPWAVEAVQEWSNVYVKVVQQSFPSKNLLQRILDDGGEGLILKHKHHTYGDERLWVKVKGEWTADVVIMGFTEGKGKYKGQVGSIIFGQWVENPHHGTTHGLQQCGTCSGFDDALRTKFTLAAERYEGRVIEIDHNGREPTGAFRHPRFKRFRPDKSPKDCVYREDET